jgi:DNA-binding response OmpR family regulator
MWGPTAKPFTILCVDDEELALNLRCKVLERAGYAVLAARDAEQAMALFLEQDVDLVLSDHLLLGMTGLELVTMMKQAKPSLATVLLSGVMEPPPGVDTWVDAYIVKGGGPEELLKRVEGVLRGRKAKHNRVGG